MNGAARHARARTALHCLSAVLAALLAFAAAPGCASAAGDEAGSTPEVGQLTDRYDSLNELSTSKNSDDAVVVDTRISVLTSVNRALDGMTVRFSGEAVGEVLDAGDGMKWVNVLGGGMAIGVYMTQADAEQVAGFGSYHESGSTLEVTGVYHVACPEHEGDLDVHAASVRVMNAGGTITHEPNTLRLVMALALCAEAFVILAIFVYHRRKA